MNWEYSKSGNYWIATKPYYDNISDFIYVIHPVMGGGYIAEATNNALGCPRVAVRNRQCTKASVFNNLAKLMSDIENGKIYWFYESYGDVTKEER